MKTSIIGYPRVGALRELKFATEKYFRNEISADALQSTAKEIRKTQWTTLKNSGLDFIPSNDFSFYDNVLDTAVLFNIIPQRYKDLGLSSLNTYAMCSKRQRNRLDRNLMSASTMALSMSSDSILTSCSNKARLLT